MDFCGLAFFRTTQFFILQPKANMPEEYLDVLDEKGNLTGEKKLRSEIHAKGLWHKVVHGIHFISAHSAVWIVNSKGELMVQKRSEIKESYPGLWDISSAGNLLLLLYNYQDT